METVFGYAIHSGQADNENFEAYIERLKAKAAEPGVRELVQSTYDKISNEHNPQTDDEQADIEPLTVGALRDEFGSLADHLVDYVVFGNLPEEYEPPKLPYDVVKLAEVVTWQNALLILRRAVERLGPDDPDRPYVIDFTRRLVDEWTRS
jgi:hypothetical protein